MLFIYLFVKDVFISDSVFCGSISFHSFSRTNSDGECTGNQGLTRLQPQVRAEHDKSLEFIEIENTHIHLPVEQVF